MNGRAVRPLRRDRSRVGEALGLSKVRRSASARGEETRQDRQRVSHIRLAHGSRVQGNLAVDLALWACYSNHSLGRSWRRVVGHRVSPDWGLVWQRPLTAEFRRAGDCFATAPTLVQWHLSSRLLDSLTPHPFRIFPFRCEGTLVRLHMLTPSALRWMRWIERNGTTLLFQ